MITIPIPDLNESVLAKIKRKSFPRGSCTIWNGCRDKDGRATIMIDGKRYKVSRLLYKHTFGIDPDELYVCHTCHEPKCINPEHFKLDTQSGNVKDAIAQGTRFQPDNAKFDDSTKAEIILKKLLGTSVKELATRYKCCTGTIYRILQDAKSLSGH